MTAIRHLYLLRHAKSSWDQPGQPDHERPLAARGRRAVIVLNRYLQEHEIAPDLILCSSAERTRETLAGVLPGRHAEIESALFTAGSDQLLERLRRVDPAVRSVMVIGHNPALQMLTLGLTGRESAERPTGAEGLEEIRRKLPTGALVTLGFDLPWTDLRRGSADLVDYIRPKALMFQKS
jgi:phosphohistidine phosphatase